jgi:phosphonate transport system ATP-binding protein
LRCLNGFVAPTAGEVQVGGATVTGATGERLRLLRAEIGFVFQQFNLQRRLSVLENVLIGGLARAPRLRSLLGLFPGIEVACARAALVRVGLGEFDARRVDTLSGGQQQRVAIARVLVQKPRVILADEPMASLDPALSEAVLAQLQGISDEDGITVVISLHVLDLARRYSRRVIGLRSGRVAYDGPPEKLTDAAAQRIFADAAA